MEKFERPSFKIDTKTSTDNYGKFTIAPLERGFGTTLGNALRRVMLSSLPGGGIFAIRIDGAYHEFDTIKGVEEDISMLILNIKNVTLDINPDDEFAHELKIYAKGPTTVTAGDIICPAGVEVLNKDYVIAHVEKGAILDMKLMARIGRGYVSANDNKILYKDKTYGVDTLYTDAIYTPVVSANYNVEGYKADSNKDELEIEVTTDGSLKPNEALSYAAKILNDHLLLVANIDENISKSGSIVKDETSNSSMSHGQTLDEIPGLSNGTINCLRRAGIATIDDILARRDSIVKLEIERFGQVALDNLRAGLKQLKIDL